MFHLIVGYEELRFCGKTPERIVVPSPSPCSTNFVDENQRFEDCGEALSGLQET